jgi:hypothetical protein
MRPRTPLLLLVFLSLTLALWWGLRQPSPDAVAPPTPSPEAALPIWEQWTEIFVVEEVIQHLSHRLRGGHSAMRTGHFPTAQDLFGDVVTSRDLGRATGWSPVRDLPARLAVQGQLWEPAAEPRRQPRGDLELWSPFFGALDRIDEVTHEALDGRFVDSFERTGFELLVRFRFRGQSGDGALVISEADARIHWSFEEIDSGQPSWRITGWSSEGAKARRAGATWFAEVLDELIQDPELRTRARNSLHQSYVRDLLADPVGFRRPHERFELIAHDRHPALAVVDIDSDGWDDLYVMMRWGTNMLLRNLEGRGFRDVAPELGLDIENHTTSAVFLDFDNDGDLDAFLGRSLARSQLLMNEGGRFVDRSVRCGAPLPMLVSAVSAADYNRDGLLDLYLSTYAAVSGPDYDPELPPIPQYDQANSDEHPVKNSRGPANLLLRNEGGGRLVRAPADTGAQVHRHTYQASWSDFDADGDPDLYLANDYAPNTFLRNRGDGTFEDATEQTRTSNYGFGMGASWGDYDNDGRIDLYVSNMFSTPGKRITDQLRGLDPNLAKMTHGNLLFRSLGSSFETVSGLEPPALLVQRTGWSWGAQFVDVDNDTFLDIVVPNGYFTAPEEFEQPVDT